LYRLRVVGFGSWPATEIGMRYLLNL